MATPFQTAVLALTPTIYYECSDTVGSATAADSSGNGHTLTAFQVTFGQTGPMSGANASNACLFTPANSSQLYGAMTLPWSTNTFSVGCWFKTTLTTPQCMFSSFDANNSQGWWRIAMSEGHAGHVCLDDSQGHYIETNSAFNDGAWHFVVCTMDSTGTMAGIKIYIDGCPQATTISGTWLPTGDFHQQYTLVGYDGYVPSPEFFSGTISDCMGWTATTLTAAQVRSLAQTGGLPANCPPPSNGNFFLVMGP